MEKCFEYSIGMDLTKFVKTGFKCVWFSQLDPVYLTKEHKNEYHSVSPSRQQGSETEYVQPHFGLGNLIFYV